MADVMTNIELLKQVAGNPRAQLDKYLAEGKEVIGTFPYFTPEVIADAAGIVPMGMWGGQTEASLSRKYLVAFACPIMHSCMELGLSGAYKGVKAVMIPTMCDTLRCVTQDFKKGVTDIKTIAFTYPQNRKMRQACTTYLVQEFGYVKEQIESIYGVKVEEGKMLESIEVYNEHNTEMMRFADLANDHLDVIDPVTRHAVMKSAWFMTKAEHLQIVKEINDALEKMPVHEWTGKRIILTGITAEPDNLLQMLADQKLAVVGDDLSQESRQYRTLIPEGESALERLSLQWLDRVDPMAHGEKIGRVSVLEDLLKKNDASAVIHCLMKFCDPEEYEYVSFNSALRSQGYKVLSIDIDQQPGGYDQARTRIQTLAEML